MQDKDVELTIGGTLQQKLSSCFAVMDILLKQKEPIVSSMVVAEKRNLGKTGNMVETVAHIIGMLKDLLREIWLLLKLCRRYKGPKNY